MRVPNRLMLACAALCLLPVSLSRAEDIKAPIRGLVSMGAYRFVGAEEIPSTHLSRSMPSPASSAVSS